MSMELAKKTFETKPDYLIAGTVIGITTATKKAAAAIPAHAPVVLGADGKVTAVSAKTTGSGETAKVAVTVDGLYGITADGAQAADEEVVVYLTGEFFADGLVLLENVKAADLEVPFRNIGIFLK